MTMKKIGLLALLLTGLLANAFANGKKVAEKVTVNVSESSLEWIGEKVCKNIVQMLWERQKLVIAYE